MNWLILTALVVLGLYVTMCCALYLLQDRLLYFPSPAAQPRNATAILVPAGGVTLKIWQLHGHLPHALLYFGGNAEDVAAKIPEFTATFPDRAVYLVHYRGYGGTAGAPSERLLIEDAQAIYDTLASRHVEVAVMGRSLGSGVATAVAATRPVRKLILVTPYDSIAKVAADHYRWAPVRWLIRDSYDSVRRMKNVRAQVLVVIAARDDVVRGPRSAALAAAIPPDFRHVRVFMEASHNDITLQPGYREAIREFLAGEAVPARANSP